MITSNSIGVVFFEVAGMAPDGFPDAVPFRLEFSLCSCIAIHIAQVLSPRGKTSTLWFAFVTQ